MCLGCCISSRVQLPNHHSLLSFLWPSLPHLVGGFHQSHLLSIWFILEPFAPLGLLDNQNLTSFSSWLFVGFPTRIPTKLKYWMAFMCILGALPSTSSFIPVLNSIPRGLHWMNPVAHKIDYISLQGLLEFHTPFVGDRGCRTTWMFTQVAKCQSWGGRPRSLLPCHLCEFFNGLSSDRSFHHIYHRPRSRVF